MMVALTLPTHGLEIHAFSRLTRPFTQDKQVARRRATRLLNRYVQTDEQGDAEGAKPTPP